MNDNFTRLLLQEDVTVTDTESLRREFDALQSLPLSDRERLLVALSRVNEASSAVVVQNEWEVIPPSIQSRTMLYAVGFGTVAALFFKVVQRYAFTQVASEVWPLWLALWGLVGVLLGFVLTVRPSSNRFRLQLGIATAVALALSLLVPATPTDSNLLLSYGHTLIVAWALVCGAYVGDSWSNLELRLNFFKITGEWFLYYVLIALGGGVLTGLAISIFSWSQVPVGTFIEEWVLVPGAVGAAFVALALTFTRSQLMSNIAAILARIFIPLFTLLLAGFIALSIQAGAWSQFDRDLLAGFDGLLVLVTALAIFASATAVAPARTFTSRATAALLALAWVGDVLVMTSMIARVGDFGLSANRTAALGLNILLLINLSRAAWLQLKYERGQVSAATTQNWQSWFLPIFVTWAAIVAWVFPHVFTG